MQKKYRVSFYKGYDCHISTDIWYGTSAQDVKFWIELAIHEIMNGHDIHYLRYTIDEL